ncbi:MAG: hypothetical protein WDO16_20865 [Bacteroidota bacterium]
MKKFLFLAPLFLLVICANAQQLSQVTFAKGAAVSSIAFLTDQGVLIRMTEEGKIIEWGTEVKAFRYDVYAPALQPFAGRVDYYGARSRFCIER